MSIILIDFILGAYCRLKISLLALAYIFRDSFKSNFDMFFRSTVPPPNLSESYVEIIDPKKQEEERKKKIDQEMNSSEIVANAKLMGFSEENIRSTIKR